MKGIRIFMSKLHNPDLAKLFLRIALGIVFINAGWMKIQNAEMVIGFFGSFGVPSWLTYIVMYVEFLGGIALILGILVQYASVLLAIVMLVAMFKVHWPNGYSLANNGYEYVLVLLLGLLALITLGRGKYALGHLLKK